jgi:hypothetical protein
VAKSGDTEVHLPNGAIVGGVQHLKNVPAPTVEELVDLIIEIDKDPEKRETELAQRLYRVLLWELGQHLGRWPQQVVDLFRWATFTKGVQKVGYGKADTWAAAALKGSPWEGSAATIKTSYKKFQGRLSFEHRRPRTYRPHPTRQI